MGKKHLPWGLTVMGLYLCAIASAFAGVDVIPSPDRQAARILISGRTFKPDKVDVAKLGQVLPETFAGIPLSNTAGFSWFVSTHFALKTDMDDVAARQSLELLECAYPYYVHVFGGEPAGIDRKRMPVVFASDKRALERALKSDGIKWDFGGGGITYERIHIAYAYPSGTLTYHRRYILLHECTHLFQMCLSGQTDNTPPWFYEGIADAISSHVFNEQTGRITLDVLDKGVTPNFLDTGLQALRARPQTIREINRDARLDRGVAFVLVNFLRGTPDREQRLHVWYDQMQLRHRTHDQPGAAEERERLLGKAYGSMDSLETEFAAWSKARRQTFHYVQWGWEQDGNTFQAYGFADDGKLSQMDVLLPPGEKPASDPWRLDYAADEMPATVGPVARGVAEPSIGALLDFRNEPGRGLAGIGLALGCAALHSSLPPGHSPMLRVLVREGKWLDLDASTVTHDAKSFKLPENVRAAMAADAGRVGLTVQIREKLLRATLRAKGSAATPPAEFTATLPLDDQMRKCLLDSPMTLLARGGWHRITPFFDEGKRAQVDPLTESPIGRWNKPGAVTQRSSPSTARQKRREFRRVRSRSA